MYTTCTFLSALRRGGVGTGASEERERDIESVGVNTLSPSLCLLFSRTVLVILQLYDIPSAYPSYVLHFGVQAGLQLVFTNNW